MADTTSKNMIRTTEEIGTEISSSNMEDTKSSNNSTAINGKMSPHILLTIKHSRFSLILLASNKSNF